MSKKIDYAEKKFFHNSTLSFYVNYIILLTRNIYFICEKKTIMQTCSQSDSIILC